MFPELLLACRVGGRAAVLHCQHGRQRTHRGRHHLPQLQRRSILHGLALWLLAVGLGRLCLCLCLCPLLLLRQRRKLPLLRRRLLLLLRLPPLHLGLERRRPVQAAARPSRQAAQSGTRAALVLAGHTPAPPCRTYAEVCWLGPAAGRQPPVAEAGQLPYKRGVYVNMAPPDADISPAVAAAPVAVVAAARIVVVLAIDEVGSSIPKFCSEGPGFQAGRSPVSSGQHAQQQCGCSWLESVVSGKHQALSTFSQGTREALPGCENTPRRYGSPLPPMARGRACSSAVRCVWPAQGVVRGGVDGACRAAAAVVLVAPSRIPFAPTGGRGGANTGQSSGRQAGKPRQNAHSSSLYGTYQKHKWL